MRNLASHTYKDELAEKAYTAAQQFLPEGRKLLQRAKAASSLLPVERTWRNRLKVGFTKPLSARLLNPVI